ncbi:MAG: UDP-N-acetylmuramoyl-tripeptide--D-alanyl-D-alanine ligase [Deltaproteobacteria bacterium]|nr:UDP-N-acetylmuramoyl-tripeptide--D-alanyl-D-alanine ligase [Deltaproteobacteria bacterium]
MRLLVRWIAEVVRGRMERGDPETEWCGVSTDSRSIQPGQVFWALQGERFDGHDFLSAAVEKGASCLLVRKGAELSGIGADVAIVEVDDTLRALGNAAAHYRRLFNIPVVAVTGSNGKTTTKEMIATLLSTRKHVLKNEGNLNNLIGLPLSLLRLSPDHDVSVVEMGMNQRAEIARLTEIADPTVGVITNIGPVHLEHLQSVEAVAACKGELLETMSAQGTAVINHDDPMIEALSRKWKGEKITIGIKRSSDVTAHDIRSLGEQGLAFEVIARGEKIPVVLPMIGEHNVMNTLAAVASLIALGETTALIPEGLAHFRNLSLRQEILSLPQGITVINDAYNANPVSMKAALQTFLNLKGESRGGIVLGDMLELGAGSNALHRQLGEEIARSNITYLLLLGNHADEVKAGAIAGGLNQDAIVIAREHGEVNEILRSIMNKGDWILVKGSRAMEMEKVIKKLIEDTERRQETRGPGGRH